MIFSRVRARATGAEPSERLVARHGRGPHMLSVRLALLVVAGAVGCEQTAEDDALDDEGVEDLTIVVEADKTRIMEEERNLQERRKAITDERARLVKERTDIAKQLASLSKKDKKQRAKLEAEEQRLANEERRVRDRTEGIESERAKLEREKTQLLDRISSLTKTKGGLTLVQREELIGQREKALAKREADLAAREKEVSRREAEVSKNLGDLGKALQQVRSGSLTRTVVVNAPGPTSRASRDVSKGSVQRGQRQLRDKMDAKGILLEDLPPHARELNRAANAAYKSKDYPSSNESLTQLTRIVEGIVVNEAFVKAKMSRINRAYDEQRQKQLKPKQQQRVQKLLAEVSESYSDGRFDRANRKINQIHALLQAP